jgi:hypothetical protein
MPRQLLIQSFPTPPSHVPTINPPPSRPPSVPLPPLPGPSRYLSTRKLSLEEHSDILDLVTMLPTPPSSNPSPHRHVANESISSIDIRDLMLDNENIYDDPPVADPIDPHLTARMLRIRIATSPVSSPPSEPLPPIPGTMITSTVRPSSPDIQAIISTTPRPSRRSKSQPRARSSIASTSSLPTSQSLSKSTSTQIKRRASEGVAHPTKSRGRRSEAVSSYSEASELPYVRGSPSVDDDARSWIEPHEFGVHTSLGSDEEDRLQHTLEGEGSESDSSLDIHTPLP